MKEGKGSEIAGKSPRGAAALEMDTYTRVTLCIDIQGVCSILWREVAKGSAQRGAALVAGGHERGCAIIAPASSSGAMNAFAASEQRSSGSRAMRWRQSCPRRSATTP